MCCQDRWEREYIPPIRRERSTPSELQYKGWSRSRPRTAKGGQRERAAWINGTSGRISGWNQLKPSGSSHIDRIVKLRKADERVVLGGLEYSVDILDEGRASLVLPPLLGGDVWDQHQLLVEVVAVHGLPECFPSALKAQIAGGGKERRTPVSKGFGLKVCACRVVVDAGEGEGASSAAEAEAEHGPIAVQHIDGYEGERVLLCGT